MKKNVLIAIVLFIILTILNLILFLNTLFTSANFLVFFSISSVLSLVVFFSNRVKTLKLGGQQLELFEEAKNDIKDYLGEIYSTQLSGIISNEVLSIPIGKDKSIDFEYFIEIYDKTIKYKLLNKLKPRLLDAIDVVLERQEYLLAAYSQKQIDNSKKMTMSYEDKIEEYKKSANYSVALKHLGSIIKNEKHCEELLDNSILNYIKLIEIREKL